jgi:hypothetical protein
MNKIIEYQVAVSEGNFNELVEKVNQLIKEGFQPLGGISSTSVAQIVCYSQAMVKAAQMEKQAIPTPIYKT